MTSSVNLDNITLTKGSHASWKEGACVMELAAYIVNEPWSDHPACVSPVLGAFLRAWNDALDETTRQRLKPYAARVIGTANDGKDQQRAWMAVDWLCHVCAPAFLDLARLGADAHAFRSLPPFADTYSATTNLETLKAGQKHAAAALDAAWAAAGAAARDAAWDAAWDAALDAAGDAAGAAAWDAAWAAAWAAARDAAGAAAGDAAWAAAWAALKPTTQILQESAFDLLDRMVNLS